MSTKPLKHLKIIDLSTVLAGPAVGTFFAELGAQVIKIEHPINRDITNTWRLASESQQTHQSAYYSSVNYLKEILALDLSNQAHYGKFLKLLKNADVLIMNFKKGDDKKLKVTTRDLWKVNPGLIIGKITGFGSNNDRIAYDLILQAESGFMAMNGTKESGPTKMPVALIDILAAHQLKEGILLALLKRQKNIGQVVSVSLYDAAICSLANQASNFLMAGHIPERIGSLHPNIAPYGEIFYTNDGQIITLAIGSDSHFKKLVNCLKLSKLETDEQFKSNILRVRHRFELQKILQQSISKISCRSLLEQLMELNVPVAQIKTLDSVFDEGQAKSLVRTELVNGQMTKRVSQVAFKFER